MPILFAWVALATWPARIAARKGYSFVGYFIFSLCLWPVALVMAYTIDDRTTIVQDGPAPTAA